MSRSTANYFLLLLWQAMSLVWVSFVFAADLTTAVSNAAVASLAVAFEVNCGSQIYAPEQDKTNRILCLGQQNCQCRKLLDIITSVTGWEHQKGSLSVERGNGLPTLSTGHLGRQGVIKTQQLQKSWGRQEGCPPDQTRGGFCCSFSSCLPPSQTAHVG